jgi:integrase
MIYRALSADLLFSVAFELWISRRILDDHGTATDARYLAPKSERDYRVCAKALSRYFGDMRLDQIHAGHLMVYQEARAVNASDAGGAWRCQRGPIVRGEFRERGDAEVWAAKCGGQWEIVQTRWAHRAGANCIRKEIALLVRILKSARLWGDEQAAAFERLRPQECESVRALTQAEQHRLLHVAGSRAEFRFMYQYAILALQTTAGTNELRALRLGDVMLADRILQIPRAGAKNRYRMRAIPLVTDEAVWALEGLLGRARELGAALPSDYLFPARPARGRWDPTRPMSESGLKKPWDALRRAAGLPNVRLYDLRHTGITRMAEAGVPLPVAMTFAGHMTRQSQQRYTAISMASQREWGAAVWARSAMGSGVSLDKGQPESVGHPGGGFRVA